MDDKPKAPPIEPLSYLSGVKVVDIGDLRIARGMSRRPYHVCKHAKMIYDQNERRIWCSECECNIEPFDAFEQLVSRYNDAYNDISKRIANVAEAEANAVISRAAKNVDHAWRKRNLSPCCPHCRGVLLPEDFATGIGQSFNSDMERQRRMAKSKQNPATSEGAG